MTARKNAARRNNALRKLRKSVHIDPEIKLAIEVIIDLLSPKSDYNAAWPSAATIAGRLKRGRRSGLWYVRIIKKLGIFKCLLMSPQECMDFCQTQYGFKPKLDQCQKGAPNLFIVNSSHPLWDSSKTLPPTLDESMGRTIAEIKALRNAKTTRGSAGDAPAPFPGQIEPPLESCYYDIHSIRQNLFQCPDVLNGDESDALPTEDDFYDFGISIHCK
jgi:hypothetical protein